MFTWERSLGSRSANLALGGWKVPMRRFTNLFTILLILVASTSTLLAQKEAKTKSQLCTRNSALDIIQQQNATAKTLDSTVQRIAIMLRAADLMWPHQQAKARATFTEAFDLALADFKEKGDQTTRDGRMPVQLPDQRYLVIGAIAKRDPAWARKLSDQLLQDAQTTEQEPSTRDPKLLQKNAEKLLGIALGLVESDPQAALTFARSSLRYTATLYLPLFLYRLADKNRSLADVFYPEALAAYAAAPMEQFLYLSSYPFANSREAGEMPGWMIYQVPAAVTPNPNLQRPFVQALLRQAQALGQNSPETKPGTRYPEAAQIWMAISRLEAQIQSTLPDLYPAAQEAKGSMLVMMSQKDQQRSAASLVEPPKLTFDEQIEDASKQSDPGRRESIIALAILNVSEQVPIDQVIVASDKIDDSGLRAQVLSRFHFNRAQMKLKNKEFAEARQLASKVDNLDQRAYLYSRIVTESTKEGINDPGLRDILEEVVALAAKAPNTEVKARALFAVAHVFAKVDAIRSIGVLGEAIKTVNQIENPDFSRDYVMTRIEGKQFGSYSRISTPGFNPDNAFREMGKFDFDGMLYQVGQLNNKQLRAMTTFALIEPCLQQTAPPKPKPAKSGQ